MNERANVFLEMEAVISLLRTEVERAGGQAAWAKKTGVHRTIVNSILQGRWGSALTHHPRFPHLEVFLRRPPARAEPFGRGRHPKIFTGTDLPQLFNNLVSAQQERLRDREAERLGGSKVDHQFELGGLLDRHVFGFAALQDIDHKDRAPSK
jgi:hypothetical protein